MLCCTFVGPPPPPGLGQRTLGVLRPVMTNGKSCVVDLSCGSVSPLGRGTVCPAGICPPAEVVSIRVMPYFWFFMFSMKTSGPPVRVENRRAALRI